MYCTMFFFSFCVTATSCLHCGLQIMSFAGFSTLICIQRHLQQHCLSTWDRPRRLAKSILMNETQPICNYSYFFSRWHVHTLSPYCGVGSTPSLFVVLLGQHRPCVWSTLIVLVQHRPCVWSKLIVSSQDMESEVVTYGQTTPVRTSTSNLTQAQVQVCVQVQVQVVADVFPYNTPTRVLFNCAFVKMWRCICFCKGRSKA